MAAVWLHSVWADGNCGMVKLINFFRQGGVYAGQFLYSFPRSSMNWIRAYLGHIATDIFSFSVATKYPALFRTRSTWLTFSSPVRCCPEFTPRLSRGAVMSSLHAKRGTICDPVPSKLQAESGELNEQVKVTFILQTATWAELDQCKESTTAVCRW